jgi:hypothetical protein
VTSIHLQAFQYRWERGGDRTFLVFWQDATAPVNQFEIITEAVL